MANLTDLASSLSSALQNLPPTESIQDAERFQILGLIEQLQNKLEPPFFTILNKFCFSHHALVVVRIAQGMGIFDAFAASNNTEMGVEELHSKTKGDQEFLERTMRHLCALKVFKQTDEDKYQPLPLAPMFVGELPTGSLIRHVKKTEEEANFDSHTNMLVAAKLHEYLKNNGYKSPDDAYNSPFQFAYQTQDHYFEWLKKDPEEQQAFNKTMTVGRQAMGTLWFEYFPVVEKLQASPERTLLVDIGGGIGYDLSQLKKEFPDLPGRLVVQDLPEVIDDISEPLPDGVEAVKYDMFTPQPIVGAKAYCLRTVLHDWPDRQALEVLARVREAMAEDSILLLIENVFPDSNVPATSASLDLTMMTMFSSLERTRGQWASLLEKGGFRLVHVWTPEQENSGRNSVFEAVRV
ncbi:hypothetical protein UA08_07103 [Talaromyces atroroseus]|uniref:Uncharacterized protein n=1 Tax=Talaromyces atroroseus TaxID=1441469 RepID=A0A225A9Z5_TALAT|nr:hypothetical protein UA08_07103 [Talaromyces atroroseus]OKL57751.1 hypothetical protein UA08_07103 [Talaromyces atroroseus]